MVGVQLHSLLISALDGGEWSGSRSGRFSLGVKPVVIHLTQFYRVCSLLSSVC
jgi:hypothetical protein